MKTKINRAYKPKLDWVVLPHPSELEAHCVSASHDLRVTNRNDFMMGFADAISLLRKQHKIPDLITLAEKWCDEPINEVEEKKYLNGDMYDSQGEAYSADDLMTQLWLWVRDFQDNEEVNKEWARIRGLFKND